MTDEQKQKARALEKCSFLPGSYQKRFAHSVAATARYKPELDLTEKQAKYLNDLFHQYRRQIKVEHVRFCDCAEAKKARAALLQMVLSTEETKLK